MPKPYATSLVVKIIALLFRKIRKRFSGSLKYAICVVFSHGIQEAKHTKGFGLTELL